MPAAEVRLRARLERRRGRPGRRRRRPSSAAATSQRARRRRRGPRAAGSSAYARAARSPRDVELVVDVDVRARSPRPRRPRSPPSRARARSARGAATCRPRRRRPRPGSRSTGRRAPQRHERARSDCTIRPVTTITCSPASRARASAASVRGRSTPSCQISVWSRSVATTSTSRGKPRGGSAVGLPPDALTT